jgi:hypothetical protein
LQSDRFAREIASILAPSDAARLRRLMREALGRVINVLPLAPQNHLNQEPHSNTFRSSRSCWLLRTCNPLLHGARPVGILGQPLKGASWRLPGSKYYSATRTN